MKSWKVWMVLAIFFACLSFWQAVPWRSLGSRLSSATNALFGTPAGHDQQLIELAKKIKEEEGSNKKMKKRLLELENKLVDVEDQLNAERASWFGVECQLIANGWAP